MKFAVLLLFVGSISVASATGSPAAPGPSSFIYELFTMYSGSPGIKFKKSTLQKALKDAKASGKLVFIDVYTTWCVPCKEMAKTTFQSSKVGTVYNDNFINIKIDAEHDADGAFLEKNYGVAVYPTLLYLDENGKLLKKIVGKQSEEKLISVANNLL